MLELGKDRSELSGTKSGYGASLHETVALDTENHRRKTEKGAPERLALTQKALVLLGNLSQEA